MKDFNPDFLTEELRKRGDEWADKDAAFYALDETKKDVLADCKAQISNSEDEKITDGKREDMARRSPRWKEFQAALTQAKRELNFAKVKYTTWQAYLELVRSKQATLREEMKLV